MAKARSSKGVLLPPVPEPNVSADARANWLSESIAGFVQPSQANQKYYAEILRTLWPENHGLPGPIKTEDDIRAAINKLRGDEKEPYKDVFRRVRELQGEEGFTCIIKEGTKYQLQSPERTEKRAPRVRPSNEIWKDILGRSGHRCAHCGQQEPTIKLSPDHRRPRSRQGNNDPSNLQPLCEQCNIQKSSACQGCAENCTTCPWAFPETYKPIFISTTNREYLRRLSEKKKEPPSELANAIIKDFFNSNKI